MVCGRRALPAFVSLSLGLACLSGLLTGCDRYTRHQVLTFFFTGVPSLEEEGKMVKKEIPQEKRGEDKNKKSRGILLLEQPRVFAHGPYGAGECYRCHDVGDPRGFRPVAEKMGTLLPNRIGIESSGRLVAKAEELCSSCHDYKTNSFAYPQGMWVHGPVSQGKCTTCHSPHNTKYRYMLWKESSRELCGQCHEDHVLQMTSAHQKEPKAECISCHNPHLGKTRLLLKADYKELF